MLRTLITTSSLGLTIICAAYSAESFRRTRPSVLSVEQSASPTPTPIHNGSLPVVSPDGLRIAFTSDRGGADDLFVIGADGSNERQLTHTPEAEGNLAWPAATRQILFSVFKDDHSRLYAIDPDGTNDE